MDKVANMNEAMDFFIKNSSGNCVCVKDDGTEKEVDCYPEAVKFFGGKS